MRRSGGQNTRFDPQINFWGSFDLWPPVPPRHLAAVKLIIVPMPIESIIESGMSCGRLVIADRYWLDAASGPHIILCLYLYGCVTVCPSAQAYLSDRSADSDQWGCGLVDFDPRPFEDPYTEEKRSNNNNNNVNVSAPTDPQLYLNGLLLRGKRGEEGKER